VTGKKKDDKDNKVKKAEDKDKNKD